MVDSEITEQLIKFLRTNFDIIDFEKGQQIVPKELTHEFLLSNFEIDSKILDVYFYPTNDLITESEYNDFVQIGFAGDKHNMLKPYSIIYKCKLPQK